MPLILSFFVFIILAGGINAQIKEPPVGAEVLTLGVFHFNFPNLDVKQIAADDRVDVLEEKYQSEIRAIAEALKEFRPSRIVIERPVSYQHRCDSLYAAYRRDGHILSRDESEQLGFRIAASLNIARLECADDWGKMYSHLDFLFSDTSARARTFEKYYMSNPDTIYDTKGSGISFAGGRGIIDNLISMNSAQKIRESLGAYLTGHFKYEEKEGDYTGADFETGRWFSRNLRIFRNIQRGNTGPSDRILVIYGSGHLNLLNIFFEASPEYRL